MTENRGNGASFTGPGTYQIRVKGRLDASWSDRVGGMTVVTSGGGGTLEETVLKGSLPDQGALSGVLNTVYELQLTVLSVERLPDDDAGL